MSSGSVIGKAPIVSMPHWGGIISQPDGCGRSSLPEDAQVAAAPQESSYQKKPTVPGPACVPTTGPSTVAIIDHRIRANVLDSSRSEARRSGAAACAIPTLSCGESVEVASNICLNSANALALPRTRLMGITSPSRIVRIGFTFSRFPANAAAPSRSGPRVRGTRAC